ncbi:MAG: hypothetical protein QOD06_2160, partial [Candidatus Binatota bacterium]|nr:hypothetical protein [Candidatus Binatota bacterium]
MTRSAWLRVAMVATLLPYASAHARSMGIMGQYAAGCGAPSCHSTSESTTAQITLSAPAMIPPRGSANVTVSISDPSVPLTGINQGGFDLKTDGGTFTASAGTQNFSDIEVGHNMAGNNQRSWTIPWAAGAPSLCEFTLQAAANAVNGDGAPGTEDHWRRASASIRVDARGDTKAPVATIVDPAPGNAYVNDSSMGYPLAVPIVVGTITIEVSASDDIGI